MYPHCRISRDVVQRLRDLFSVAYSRSLSVAFRFCLPLDFGRGFTLFNRKNKAVKIVQQFTDLVTHNRYPTYCNLDRLIMTFEHFSILQIAEQLQLTPSILFTELANGKINFSDANRTLRENFPHNDEKIFAAVTIALKLRFNPKLK